MEGLAPRSQRGGQEVREQEAGGTLGSKAEKQASEPNLLAGATQRQSPLSRVAPEATWREFKLWSRPTWLDTSSQGYGTWRCGCTEARGSVSSPRPTWNWPLKESWLCSQTSTWDLHLAIHSSLSFKKK